MKRILIALAAAAVAVGAWSAVTEIITLRNGNVYKGSIWVQLSDGQIGFNADTSIVYLPSSEISRIERLPAKKNDKHPRADIYLMSEPDTVAVEEVVSAVADTAYADCDSVVTVEEAGLDEVITGSNPDVEVLRNVELLEEGSIVKYLDTTPRDLQLRLKDVRLITRPPRNPKQINGLEDEIIAKSGTYKGNIISTEPGKSLRIESDGRVYSILLSDIEVQRKVAIDKEESVFAQSPIIDNIYFGKKKGVILDVVLIEQNYTNGTFDVIDRHNVVTRRPLADIVKIRKEINREYSPVMEFSFQMDSLYVNRKIVEEYSYVRKNDRIRLRVNNNVMIPTFKREKGCINVEGSDGSSILRTILVSLGNAYPQEVNINMADLLVDNIPVRKQETDPQKGIILREYPVKPGYYALINTGNSTMTIFKVL